MALNVSASRPALRVSTSSRSCRPRPVCGGGAVAGGADAGLELALAGDSRHWLRLALAQADLDPLGVALDAAALWNALRSRAVEDLDAALAA